MVDQISRRTFIGHVSMGAAGMALSQVTCSLSSRKKPNIIFILADDLGWSQVGCYGSEFYETPHIDRLASAGMRFTDAYAACPVCSPTRASIMTGKYPARLHITDYLPGNNFPYAKYEHPDWQKYLPLEEETIAESLKRAGYRTACFGKWHLSIDKKPPKSEPYNPDKQGFDEYFVTYKPKKTDDGDKDAHNVEIITQKSLQFIDENRDKPFFLFVSHNSIHAPIMERSGLIQKYQEKPGADKPENNPVLGAMIETLDNSVGRILNKIEQQKLEKNTVVIFFGDNGGLKRDAHQTPLRGGKAMLLEGGIREPLVICWPGKIKPRSICQIPVSSIDFSPTFEELAHVSVSKDKVVDGVSLMPLLLQKGEWKRDTLFWHYPHYHSSGIGPSGAVRKENFKLIEWFDETVPGIRGKYELYNLENDIGEKQNLADVMPNKVMELKSLLRQWRKDVKAQMVTPNPNYNPEKAFKSGR